MAGGAQDDDFLVKNRHGRLWGNISTPLDFHGAGGRGRRPWCCQRAPSSRTGADGPQAEERAKAADAHRIARVPCDEFLIFVFCFSRRGSEKKHGLSGCKKKVPPNSKVLVSIRTVLSLNACGPFPPEKNGKKQQKVSTHACRISAKLGPTP